MNYALEKLGIAIYEITVGEEKVKQRLLGATKYLSLLSINDFPDSLREDWELIVQRLTNKDSIVKGTKYDEGPFEATLFRMHNKTASNIVKDIIEIHDHLGAHIKDGLWS